LEDLGVDDGILK